MDRTLSKDNSSKLLVLSMLMPGAFDTESVQKVLGGISPSRAEVIGCMAFRCMIICVGFCHEG